MIKERLYGIVVAAFLIVALVVIGKLFILPAIEAHRLRLLNEEKRKITISTFKNWELPPEKEEVDIVPPKDGWGRATKYIIDPGILTNHYLLSAGVDGAFGTVDDIQVMRYGDFHIDKAGEKVGEKTTEFGVGMVKGAAKTLKKVFTSDE